MKNTKLKLISFNHYKEEFEEHLQNFMNTNPDIISIHFSTTVTQETHHSIVYSALIQYK